MRTRKRQALVPLLPALAVAGWLASAACVTASEAPNPWLAWKTLRMKVKAIPLFSGEMEMARHREGDTCVLETRATARFLGARIAQSRTVSVLDARTDRPLRYESVSKKKGRRYIFGERGYRIEKLASPAGDDVPLEEWEVLSTEEHAYPSTDEGEVVDVFDYYGMLLHLRRLDLRDVGDEAVIHVATGDGAVAYRVVVGEAQEGEQKVVDPEDGSRRTLPVRQLRLRVIPADPELADEGFLEMEGETELWVEAVSKTLLRISGKVSKVPGRVRLVLAEMG